MAARNYRDLEVWQCAMDLCVSVYGHSSRFPTEERYGLTSQLRRSAVSVPSNIAEGQGRDNDREFANFLRIANGSLRELETKLMIAERLQYIDPQISQELLELSATAGRLINGLLRKVREQTALRPPPAARHE